MEKLHILFTGLLAFILSTVGISSKPIVNQTPIVSTSSVVAQTPILITTTASNTEIFVDPEGRYKIIIPKELTYEYKKDTRKLYFFTKNLNSQNKLAFAIDYLTKKEYEENSHKDLTDKEINRTLKKNGQEIKIYNPIQTEACHEEAMIPLLDGGFLSFYNVCGNNESMPLLDKLILTTEIIKQ